MKKKQNEVYEETIEFDRKQLMKIINKLIRSNNEVVNVVNDLRGVIEDSHNVGMPAIGFEIKTTNLEELEDE